MKQIVRNSWLFWDHNWHRLIVTTGVWRVGQPETIIKLLLLLDCEQLASLRPSSNYCYYWTVSSWLARDHHQIIVTTGLWTVGQPETILSLLLLLDSVRLASLIVIIVSVYVWAISSVLTQMTLWLLHSVAIQMTRSLLRSVLTQMTRWLLRSVVIRMTRWSLRNVINQITRWLLHIVLTQMTRWLLRSVITQMTR
jgi:hypothetical protein